MNEFEDYADIFFNDQAIEYSYVVEFPMGEKDWKLINIIVCMN